MSLSFCGFLIPLITWRLGMELALEFSPGLINRWTRTSPSFDKIIKVAEYLDVSLDVLVSGQSEKNGNDFIERLYKKTDEKKILCWKKIKRGLNNLIQ